MLLAAFIEAISETVKENAAKRRAAEEKKRYENICWDDIKSVTFRGTETAYRIEEEEEFDLVMSDFLTQQDGWQHYETKTVEYEVEDGKNYKFTILYKNGVKIHRTFHETSPLTERLLGYCGNDHRDKLLGALINALDNIEAALNDKNKGE